MKIPIIDFGGEKREVEVDLEKALVMTITVLSGDEILEVHYEDGECRTFDALTKGSRLHSFYDDEYLIYIRGAEDNLLFNEKWLNRNSSYFSLER